MPLLDPVGIHARYTVYWVPGDSSIGDIVGVMADRGVRRLRVYMAGGYAYLTVRGIIYALDHIRDPRRLERLRASLLPLEYPPVVSYRSTVRETARAMATYGFDFAEVDTGSARGIFTVTDLIRSIAPGELDEPVAIAMNRSYPTIGPDAPLIDAVHQMRLYGVDSVLVMHDGYLAGLLDSRSLLEALDRWGLSVLGEPVYGVAERIRCVLDPSSSLGEAASLMASSGSSVCIATSRGYLVGVVDEDTLLEAAAGLLRPALRLLAASPPMG